MPGFWETQGARFPWFGVRGSGFGVRGSGFGVRVSITVSAAVFGPDMGSAAISVPDFVLVPAVVSVLVSGLGSGSCPGPRSSPGSPTEYWFRLHHRPLSVSVGVVGPVRVGQIVKGKRPPDSIEVDRGLSDRMWCIAGHCLV